MGLRHRRSPPAPLDDRQVRTNRADAGFETVMADRLHHPTRKLFGFRHWWMGRTYEHLWPLANAWSACCTLAALPDHDGVRAVLPLLLDGVAAYHPDGPAVLTGSGPAGFSSGLIGPSGRGGDVYYDDNAWLGLALVRHQELCGDDVSLPLARRVFDFVASGWSGDDGWAVPGGIRWKDHPSNRSRNACANGPAAALAAGLYRLTGEAVLADWAARLYRWTRSALLRPDQLYADRITPDGDVVGDLWSYNQGAMIGAGVLLAEITGDRDYLDQATATAAAAMAHFTLQRLVEDNTQAFNAIYFRNLALLDRAVGDAVDGAVDGAGGGAADGADVPPYAAVAAAYDDVLWDERDRRTGLFPGVGSPLNRSAPMVQIDALLAGAPPHA